MTTSRRTGEKPGPASAGAAGQVRNTPETGIRHRAEHVSEGENGKTTPEGSELPVLLTVTGKQTDCDNNTQENTAVYRAVRRNCGEGYLFSYLAEDVEVRLFLSRSRAWMQRGVSRSARMVFDPSVPLTQCDYETACGSIPMGIRTDHISVLEGGSRGLQARIRYALIMSPEYEQTCSVTIKTQLIL